MHLIVENFAKIKSADIALGDMVLLVGNNNSGKTLIMQLLYGVRQLLRKINLPDEQVKKTSLDGMFLLRYDKQWFQEVEAYINQYLAVCKEQIVEDIFGLPISIRTLKIQIVDFETTYYVSSFSEEEFEQKEGDTRDVRFTTIRYCQEKTERQFESVGKGGQSNLIQKALETIWNDILGNLSETEGNQLFLPASRSGLQMLYKSYFVNDIQGGITRPIKEYLNFLQLYSECAIVGEPQNSLIEFGESHLLKGKVVQQGEETFYVPEQEGKGVPLYIASSMIHELSPIMKALKREKCMEWLYYDEIENSLHPFLQQELSRWLVRMVNAGMHIVASTHSDTMAARLNNLFIMSWNKIEYNKLTELGLERVDLLGREKQVYVYEFHNNEQGESEVEELAFVASPLLGYDFRLFGASLDKLGEEALRITE